MIFQKNRNSKKSTTLLKKPFNLTHFSKWIWFKLFNLMYFWLRNLDWLIQMLPNSWHFFLNPRTFQKCCGLSKDFGSSCIDLRTATFTKFESISRQHLHFKFFFLMNVINLIASFSIRIWISQLSCFQRKIIEIYCNEEMPGTYV